MKSLLLLATLTQPPILNPPPLGCGAVMFEGWRGLQDMSQADVESYNTAVISCEVNYGPRGRPCLRRFILKGKQNYSAICGAKIRQE